MTSLQEAAGSGSPLNAALDAGIESLSRRQQVTFDKYVRVVLPLDGYVFWVRANLVSSLTLSALKTNSAGVTAMGSLHYSTSIDQKEESSVSVNSVVFTSEVEVQALNDVNPQVLYIAIIEGIRFSFSNRGRFYVQASIYHYVGNAVYSELATQIIDDVRQFDHTSVVVSDSLPIWLSMNTYTSPVGGLFSNPVTLYPAFLVPANLAPPYASVSVVPGETQAIQSVPFVARDGSHYQLARDLVRVTIFGTRNFEALSFQDFVNQFSLDTDYIGVMNMPLMRDEQRTQPELLALAQKKTIEYEVSYYQQTVRALSRTLILSAIPTFTFPVPS